MAISRTDDPSHIVAARMATTGVFFSRASSEVWHNRLRYRRCDDARKEGVRVVGAAHLQQRTFRCARQLSKTFDWNLAHCRLVLPEALDGVPGRRKGTRVFDVNVRLQHLAILDQVEALNHMKLFGMWRSKSIHRRPVVHTDRIDDER